jgi:hypothetical protein
MISCHGLSFMHSSLPNMIVMGQCSTNTLGFPSLVSKMMSSAKGFRNSDCIPEHWKFYFWSWRWGIIALNTRAGFLTLFFFFCGIRICAQGLVLDRQAFYHLSHTSSHFCIRLFFQWDLALCLRMASHTYLPTYASCIVGMVGGCHNTQLDLLRSGSN